MPDLGNASIKNTQALKQCPKCKVEKPVKEFYKDPSRKNGLSWECKLCSVSKMKKLYQENPTLKKAYADRYRRKNRERIRWLALRAKYNISKSQFELLLSSQGNKCAACGTSIPGGRHNQWCIDHNHSCCSGEYSCGKCIRGLLCNACNLVAGICRDNPSVVRAVADYLERG